MHSSSWPSLLADERPTRVGSWLGKIFALAYRVLGKHRYDHLHLEEIDGRPILILPSVANPRALRTGALLAAQSARLPLAPTDRVLDLGCGSGVCAVFAALKSARVVATDINPDAVRCAGINATLNGLEDRIEVRLGNLFDPVAGETFDVILFNPPFILGEPADHRDAAWRAGDLAQRFAAELAGKISSGGTALLCLSSFGDACPVYESELISRGFELSVFARRKLINETITIIQIRPPGQPGRSP